MTIPSVPELINYIAYEITFYTRTVNSDTELDLLKTNAQLTGRYGFIYGRRTYGKSLIRKCKQPHPDLLPQVQKHYAAVTQFNSKLTRLKQGLTMPLFPCKTYQDIRDMLPDILSYLPILSSYQRTRPMAYALQNNPQQMREYDETIDLITYFLSARMFV